MKTIPVNELSGPELDWAVAVAEGKEILQSTLKHGKVHARNFLDEIVPGHPHGYQLYSPRQFWGQAGPIIEREGISLGRNCDGKSWNAHLDHTGIDDDGPTPLIAAMRCFVRWKFGYSVTVPSVLVEGE